jgi:hypothetical protein
LAASEPPAEILSAAKDLSTKFLEARGGIEPPMKVLQTFALPLGDRASAAQPLVGCANLKS